MVRIDWNNYFMNIAHQVKTRSPDTKRQVGVVLVSTDTNRIISTGYNSLQAGLDDSLIDWNDRDFITDTVIHAEMNAILYAQSKFENCVLYTTTSPCINCLKVLSATKVKKIIYDEEYRDIDKVKELCKFFKIDLIKITL
jgi:dCMP deaminase